MITLKIISAKRKKAIIKSKPKLPTKGFRLFYSDEKGTNQENNVIYSKLLRSEKYNIQGKPDFIFESKKNDLVIVELKSGEIRELTSPYKSDLMQLCAYFIIVEELYKSPKYGLIIYKDFMFVVKNASFLRKKVISVIKDMRDMLKTGEQEANSSFITCKNCICKGTVCEYCD